MSTDTISHLRHIRDALSKPIESKDELLILLSQPLHLLDLLPPIEYQLAHLKPKISWPGLKSTDAQEILLARFALRIQHVLLETVLEVWWDVLRNGQDPEDDFGRALIWTWFSPSPDIGDCGIRTGLALYGLQAMRSHLSSAPVASSSTEANDASTQSCVFSVVSLNVLLSLLQTMSTAYPLSAVFSVLFPPSSHQRSDSNAKSAVQWESFVKSLLSMPAKVMNVTQGGTLVDVPGQLESNRWFGNIVLDLDQLIWGTSSNGNYTPFLLENQLSPILTGLLRQGFLGPASLNPFQPAQTFFSYLLPVLLPRVTGSSPPPVGYCKTYRKLFQALPFSDLARAAESLLRHLLAGLNRSSSSVDQVSEIVRLGKASEIMRLIIGREEEGVWDKVLLGVEASSMGSEQDMRQRAIIGIGWVGGKSKDSKALEKFMFKVLELWTDVQFIKYSLVKKHIYILTILLLTVRSFPTCSPQIIRLSFLPEFLQCLPHYLSHPDRTIRHLGMLSAEVISLRSTSPGEKVLNFDIWEGDEGGKRICRELRNIEIDWDQFGPANVGRESEGSLDLLGWNEEAPPSKFEQPSRPGFPSRSQSQSQSQPDRVSRSRTKKKKSTKVPSSKIIVLSDSDDSLTGYASSSHSMSSQNSVRSSSPSPSDLDEYIDDPTLYAPKKKKVPKPVYLTQLGVLLGSTEDPEKLEVGLKWGESLIRRKRDFGLELEENAEFIAITLAGLNDNFELEDFENRKQGILNALVCCSPRKVAPALIEQYFHNQYSLHQRSAILTALAMGAREAASLPVLTPPSITSADWPSKRLPNTLHSKFLSPSDPTRTTRLITSVRGGGAVERVADELKNLAIDRGREDAESNIEYFQREKRLRVNPKFNRRLVQDPEMEGDEPNRPKMKLPPEISFTTVAAEFFILPMINRFWNHYQEQTTLSLRSSSSSSPSATGTGMILSPLSLSKFLATLMVLVHASRHSTLFLAVIAPEALQLAVTLGSRPLSSSFNKRDLKDDEEADEISVLGSSLDLALVTLDASRDLDAGHTLVTSHQGLVLAIAEWAELVFKRTDSGERVSGEGGGEGEGKVRRSSAGVCVQVGEIRERWVRLTGL